MKLPEKITSGNNVKLIDINSDYPAPAYKLIFILVNDRNRYTVEAGAAGKDHSLELTSNTTANFQPGTYTYFIFYQNTETEERYEGGTGIVRVLANPGNVATDYRTHAVRVLDAINATIEGRASREQSEITIGGRAVKYLPLTELIKMKAHYEYLVAAENGTAVTAVRVGFGRVL